MSTNMTVPGADVVNRLCRFRLLFSMGEVEVVTKTTLSFLDDAATLSNAIEDLHVFGKNSVIQVVQTNSGWRVDLVDSCPFCRGPLSVRVLPLLQHKESPEIFNGTIMNWVTKVITTNHTVMLGNLTCPLLSSLNSSSSATTITTTTTTTTSASSSVLRLENIPMPFVQSLDVIPKVDLHATLSPNGIVMTNDLVRNMFSFSSNPSDQLMGEWKDASTLILRLRRVNDQVVDLTNTGVGRMKNPFRGGKFQIHIQEGQENRLIEGQHFTLPPTISNKKCVVDGTWGEHNRVVVVEVRASDLNDPPLSGFSVNDAISLTFDVPTNTPPSSNKEEIDSWLVFGGFITDSAMSTRLYRCPLQCLFPGTDYTGEWLDSQHLLLTIHEATLKKESGIGDGGTELSYYDLYGVSPRTQIHILTENEKIEEKKVGGFSVFAREDGPLASIDESSPPCKKYGGKNEHCGSLAVGDWGINNNMVSISRVLYTISGLYFVLSILYKFGLLVYAATCG